MSEIWAVIPVKEFNGAKHRLSGLLSPPERRLLAETMLTDMLDAVAGSRLLAGVMIVTLDPHATDLGEKIGARVTIARTLMKSLHDRETLARVTLDAADALAPQR